MELFGKIVVSVTVAAIFSGVVMAFLKETAMKEIVRLALGMLLIISVLVPVIQYKNDFFNIPVLQEQKMVHTEEVVRKNDRLGFSVIGGKLSEYIKELAEMEGISCSVRTEVSYDDGNNLVIDKVHIEYDEEKTDGNKLEALSEIIIENCGIESNKLEFVGKSV